MWSRDDDNLALQYQDTDPVDYILSHLDGDLRYKLMWGTNDLSASTDAQDIYRQLD